MAFFSGGVALAKFTDDISSIYFRSVSQTCMTSQQKDTPMRSHVGYPWYLRCCSCFYCKWHVHTHAILQLLQYVFLIYIFYLLLKTKVFSFLVIVPLAALAAWMVLFLVKGWSNSYTGIKWSAGSEDFPLHWRMKAELLFYSLHLTLEWKKKVFQLHLTVLWTPKHKEACVGFWRVKMTLM